MKGDWLTNLLMWLLGLVLVGLLALLGYGLYSAATWEPELGGDPRKERVWVDYSTTKFCDGPNLVYSKSRAVDVIENSPECKES